MKCLEYIADLPGFIEGLGTWQPEERREVTDEEAARCPLTHFRELSEDESAELREAMSHESEPEVESEPTPEGANPLTEEPVAVAEVAPEQPAASAEASDLTPRWMRERTKQASAAEATGEQAADGTHTGDEV